jgi:cell wall-associated NlpC family hydrolase
VSIDNADVTKPLLILVLAGVLAVAGFGVWSVATNGGVPTGSSDANRASAATPKPDSKDYADYPAPRPRVAVAVRPGEDPPPGATTGDSTDSSHGTNDSRARARATDAEIRKELESFKRSLRSAGPGVDGPVARILANGDAVPPKGAPQRVKMMIAAGNSIARTPYLWGGGHGAWQDDGYDCSGSVSFALAGAGLLSAPLNSTGFMSWGAEGPGDWVTIFANDGHVFMVVAGIRFDTSGRGSSGSRWQPQMRSTDGYVAIHPPGL